MVTQVKKVLSDADRGRTSEHGHLDVLLAEIFSFGMVLVAEAQQLKAKLMLKGKWRPEKMVRARRCRTAPA